MKHRRGWICGLLVLLLGLCPAQVERNYKDVKVDRIIDGDTFVADLPCADTLLCQNMRIRISDVDTPELRGADCAQEKEQAIKASEYLQNFLQNKRIDLRRCQRGDFFRLVCDVYADKEDVAALLLREGLARPYKGKKQSWCD